MAHLVTLFFVIQIAGGAVLAAGWWRHGRRGAALVITHVTTNLIALGLWVTHAATGEPLWAWNSFFVLTVGTAFGDVMLVHRARRLNGVTSNSGTDYGRAVTAVFRGRMPPLVIFHALFSPVVYFFCLGVTIGATVAAGGSPDS